MKLKLPTTHTALGVISHSGNTYALQNNDEFKDDYFIYREGKKLRKYFSHRSGWKHYWPPVIKQLRRIENLRERLRVRAEKFYARRTSLLQEILAVAPSYGDVFSSDHYHKDYKIVHAIPTHAYTKSGDKDHWLYLVGVDPNFGLSFTFEWVSKPEKLIHLDLGQKLYDMDYKVSSWSWRLDELLQESLIDWASDHLPYCGYARSRYYCVTINGRQYWLMGYGQYPENHYSAKHRMKWTILSLPGDKTYFFEVP